MVHLLCLRLCAWMQMIRAICNLGGERTPADTVRALNTSLYR